MEQPETPKIKQPPVLFNKTQTLIAEINALLGGTLITYWNNPRSSVCHSDAGQRQDQTLPLAYCIVTEATQHDPYFPLPVDPD